MSDDALARFADSLSTRGITHLFGVSGGGASLRLISEMIDRGVTYVPTATESAAAIMAGAMGRDGVARAASIGIKGPGLSSMMPGIILNSFERRAAVSITEAYAPSTPSYQKHKRMDHRNLLAQYVRGYSYGDIRDTTVERLLHAAAQEAPGPVHFDFWNDTTETSETLLAEATRMGDITAILESIHQAKRPAVVLGSYASRHLRSIPWNSLAVPVVTTAAAKGIVDETGPVSAGVMTGEIKELSPETTILAQADYIVAIGLRPDEVVRPRAFACPLGSLDCIETDLGGFSPRETVVTSDAPECASRIFEALSHVSWGSDLVAGARATLRSHLFATEWMPAAVFEHLNATDTTLVVDTGSFCTIAETVWRANDPHRFAGSSHARYMGVAIPTAIGIAVAEKQPLVCAFGDGGIAPYMAELRLAIERSLPVLFLFISDGRYGSVAPTGAAAHQEIYTFNRSWAQTVAGMGCDTHVIGSLQAFADATSAWNRQGPLFIECTFEPSTYHDMTAKLR